MRIIKETHIDFLGKRYIAAICSVIVLAIGIGSIVMNKGLNYGIDFRGGVNVQVRFQQNFDLDQLRDLFKRNQLNSVTIQRFGDLTDNEILLALPVDSKLGTGEELSSSLQELFAPVDQKIEIRRVEKVGPKVGEELKQSALGAIFIALGLILVYVSFRFHWRFALGSIVALVHDVCVIVGVFSLLNKEFNLLIVTALLTVVGYSLNDTIVVFDRIRENMGRFRRKPLVEIINLGINETLSRTLLTSITTLLVITSLLVLGGEIIHDFALALFVGVLVGTYSSIYVASPVMLWLNERFAPVEPTEASKQAA